MRTSLVVLVCPSHHRPTQPRPRCPFVGSFFRRHFMGFERLVVLVAGDCCQKKEWFGQVIPELLRIRRILLPVWRNSSQQIVSQQTQNFQDNQINIPVTVRTWAIPWESRRMTPIWEGVAPFLASLQICSTTCSGVVFNHEGGLRE